MIAFIQHKDNNNTKWIVQTLVPFMLLKESVIFTYRSDYYQDDRENSDLISKKSFEFYQRRVDAKRSDEIKKFIQNSITLEYKGEQMATLFPTSMIIALSTDDENENALKASTDEGICDIDIRSNVFIVDGKHRMMGMIKLYEELNNKIIRTDEENYIYNYLKNYKFNCTVLVNYDLWEQGQVFVNVNFKQKPVNRSLYYEIFGSEFRESEKDQKRNKIYVAHMMTKELNENIESPFFHHIKMLGTGSGYISQAFFVEAILRNFSPGGLWYFDSDQIGSPDIDYFSTELVSYFVAIKKLFTNYWPTEGSKKGTIICKTTGVGAWMRLIGMLRSDDDHEMLDSLKLSTKKGSLCEEYIESVCEQLKPLVTNADDLFGVQSEFTSSSGRGSESKLFKKMVYIIKHSSDLTPKEEIEGHNVNYYSEKILEYIWANPIDDLDSLAHHYETEDIDNFKVDKTKIDDNRLTIIASFDLEVNLFLDNEDNIGYPMSFPSKIVAEFTKDDKDFTLDNEKTHISVNTDKYYK